MNTLFIMRHGEAEAANPHGDRNRNLTLAGIEGVRSVGAALARHRISVATLIASPYERTQQTAHHLLAAWGLELVPKVDARLASGSEPRAMAEAVEEHALPVLLVGHMPDVARLTSALARNNDELRGYSPAALARVEFPGPGLTRRGDLAWLRTVNQWREL